MWPFLPRVGIRTLHDHSHLTWAFSPRVHLVQSFPTLCGYYHLSWPFSSCIYLVWPFPSLRRHSHLAWPFSPCIHLGWPFFTSCEHLHLPSTSHDLISLFPIGMGILTTCPPCTTISHLAWVFSHCMTILTAHLPCMTISHILTSYAHAHPLFTWCDHLPLHNFAILHGQEVGMAIQGDFAKVYIRENFWKSSFFALDITEITSTQSHLTSMRDNFAISLGCKVAKLSCPDARWLCKSHLVWPFSSGMLCVELSPSLPQKSPRMTILTLHGHSHLATTSHAPSIRK